MGVDLGEGGFVRYCLAEYDETSTVLKQREDLYVEEVMSGRGDKAFKRRLRRYCRMVDLNGWRIELHKYCDTSNDKLEAEEDNT